jgi:hypothetical protein
MHDVTLQTELSLESIVIIAVEIAVATAIQGPRYVAAPESV